MSDSQYLYWRPTRRSQSHRVSVDTKRGNIRNPTAFLWCTWASLLALNQTFAVPLCIIAYRVKIIDAFSWKKRACAHIVISSVAREFKFPALTLTLSDITVADVRFRRKYNPRIPAAAFIDNVLLIAGSQASLKSQILHQQISKIPKAFTSVL